MEKTTQRIDLLHPSMQILHFVAAYYGFRVEDLQKRDRHKRVALARHVAMYLLREHAKLSFPEISALMGKKDHTTAMSAVRRIAYQSKETPDLRKDLLLLTQQIVGSLSRWQRMHLLYPAREGEMPLRCSFRNLGLKHGVKLSYTLERRNGNTIASINFLNGTVARVEFPNPLEMDLLPVSAIDVAAFSNEAISWERVVSESLVRLLTQSAELYISLRTAGDQDAWIVATMHCGEYSSSAKCRPHELELYLHSD